MSDKISNDKATEDVVETTEQVKKSKKRSKNKKPMTTGNEKDMVENSVKNNELLGATVATEDSSQNSEAMEVFNTLKDFPQLKLHELIKSQAMGSIAPAKEEALQKSYKFWSTQPVPKINDTEIESNESQHKPIEPKKAISEIRQDPYVLPGGFLWDTLTLEEPQVLKELYTLLNENYVEDDDAMFRFDYQPEFLRWALQPPNWLKDWHVGVRVAKSGRLIAFISAIPAEIKIYETHQKVVEINFLCIHKKLRAKRLAPVLIREITRRVNLKGIFQAVYTAGVVLPTPVTTCRYWHRSLNPRKLIDVSNCY